MVMYFSKIFNFRLILVVLIFFSGCGSRFSGGGYFPAGIKSVFVQVYKNRTSETGIESIFTNDLRNEIFWRGTVVLTSMDKANAILSGIIKSRRIVTISHGTTPERRVTITVDMKLTDSDGRVIWDRRGLSENEEYDVVSDKLETESKRKAAIKKLSKRLAEKIYYSITEEF